MIYSYVPGSSEAHAASLLSHELTVPAPAYRVLIPSVDVPLTEDRVPLSARRLAEQLGACRVTYALAVRVADDSLVESVCVRWRGGWATWVGGRSEGVTLVEGGSVGIEAFEIARGWRDPPPPPRYAFACQLCKRMDVQLKADNGLYVHKHRLMPAWKCDGRKIRS